MDVPRRKRQRLPEFDYAQPGAYFVTINVVDAICLFGAVTDGQMRLNELGTIVDGAWRELPPRFPSIELDAFIVMPNHFHALLVVSKQGGAALPAIIGTFKSISTRAANIRRGAADLPLWHRGYHDHIVRDDADLDRIREYIADNPAKWEQDELYPARRRG